MSKSEHPSVQGPTADEGPVSPASSQLIIRPWWDPGHAMSGHYLSDDYVERYWLGVLGPSVICLLRRFAVGFDAHPRGFRLSLPDTSRAIGLGGGVSRNSPIVRTIDRACTFNVARRVDDNELDVRLLLPTLSRRQLARLPQSVQTSHARWIAENRPAQTSPRPMPSPMTSSTASGDSTTRDAA